MNRKEFEAIGDRHKKYEKIGLRQLIPGLPIMIRLDGRAFHTFARGLQRPYDINMTACMAQAAKTLLDESGALIAYTQSDEISLVLPASENCMIFGGRQSKIESVLAGIASVAFYKALLEFLPEKSTSLPVFDCRAWQYPSNDLVVDSLSWREADATRNSLSMACSSLYSQSELHKVSRTGQHELLYAKGVNWNDYPSFFKRGSYYAKRDVLSMIPNETWDAIPVKYRPGSRKVMRSEILRLDMPPIDQVTNMEAVIFGDADPVGTIQS